MYAWYHVLPWLRHFSLAVPDGIHWIGCVEKDCRNTNHSHWPIFSANRMLASAVVRIKLLSHFLRHEDKGEGAKMAASMAGGHEYVTWLSDNRDATVKEVIGSLYSRVITSSRLVPPAGLHIVWLVLAAFSPLMSSSPHFLGPWHGATPIVADVPASYRFSNLVLVKTKLAPFHHYLCYCYKSGICDQRKKRHQVSLVSGY